MAQFDVHALDGGYVVDSQADLLGHLQTRFVVPLLRLDETTSAFGRLAPTVSVNGEQYRFAAYLAASIDARLLKRPVASLETERHKLMSALDMLISGF